MTIALTQDFTAEASPGDRPQSRNSKASFLPNAGPVLVALQAMSPPLTISVSRLETFLEEACESLRGKHYIGFRSAARILAPRIAPKGA